MTYTRGLIIFLCRVYWKNLISFIDIIIPSLQLTTETTEVDDNMFGGNKSAEGGGDEDASGAISQSGINVVIAHKLVSTTYDKKSYKLHLKDFMKHVSVLPSSLSRVLASPKFLPTDSDLFSSRIRRTDRPHQNKVIIYIQSSATITPMPV